MATLSQTYVSLPVPQLVSKSPQISYVNVRIQHRKFSVLYIGFNNTVVDFSTEICLKKNCFNLSRKFPLGKQLRLITKLLTGQETALEGLFVVTIVFFQPK